MRKYKTIECYLYIMNKFDYNEYSNKTKKTYDNNNKSL